jgi:hypothetical protein
MSVLNVINGALVILVGVLYFAFLPELSASCGACMSDVLCGLYCVVNGLIFIIFSTGCIKSLDKYNRKNFGFMYTFYGRFFFVVFCGSLCFGLKDPSQKTVVGNDVVFGSHWLGILTGILSWLSALFNVWAMCNYPEYGVDRGGMLTARAGLNNPQSAGIPLEEGRFHDVSASPPAVAQKDTGADFGSVDDNPFA